MPTPLDRDALDFAPGLLAIQESPPARAPGLVLWCLSLLVLILVVWALVGQLDVVASAEGRLVPQTYVKIVQPAEGGIVQEILVGEGEAVEAGQVLMRLDARLTDADRRMTRTEFHRQALQLRRIDAELAGKPLLPRPEDPPELLAQAVSQHAARLAAYRDALAQENAQMQKTRHELNAALEVAQKLRQTVPTYQRSAEAFDKLGQQGFFSPLAVDDKRRERLEKEQDLRAQEATVLSLRSALQAGERKVRQITSSFQSDLENERGQAQAQWYKLKEELEKLDHRGELLALRAPQRGRIKDLATHTVGTVVQPGSILMSLVPLEEPLQAEVAIKNEDAGFVHAGQQVKLKLLAYPFQKYGLLDGSVTQVGPDASDAPARPGEPTPPQGLRYKALIRLASQTLETDGTPLGLAPGMQVVAEIHQGRRTVMEYLLSPVQKAWQEAGRER